MRKIIAAAGFSLATMMAALAYRQTAAEPPKADAPPKPMVYMLIAAVGEQFTAMIEIPRTGSNLPPYRRVSIKVRDNVLNRYVLYSLDKAIAETDPDSKRLTMTLRAADMDAGLLPEREKIALDEIISDLRGMPERMEWDRIVVATPAYRAFEYNGVAGHLAGFGVFYQPLGGGFNDFMGGLSPNSFGDFGAPDAVTPDNKLVRSFRYAAPFSLIDIWVLDPKTLAVLDKQQRFDNVKVFDPMSDSLQITKNVNPAALMDKVSSLIERSVAAAIAHSELLDKRGVVNVGKIKEVKAEDDKK